jgi:hypothetical protein
MLRVRRREISLVAVSGLAVTCAVASGCTCGGSGGGSATVPDVGAAGVSLRTEPASSTLAPATMESSTGFSAPIGAAHVDGGAVLVGGLVASRSVVTLTRLEATGATAWAKDILTGVSWAPHAATTVFAAPDGSSYVLWVGLRAGKAVHEIVSVDARGATRGDLAEEAPPNACATDEGVAWVAQDTKGARRVQFRGWRDAKSHVLVGLRGEGDPLLACGTHRVFPFEEGEGVITLLGGSVLGGSVLDGSARDEAKPLTLLSAATSHGEVHDHVEYTFGDDFGVVYPESSGTIAFRELRGDALGPWQHLARRLGEDASLVAADADATTVHMLVTRDSSETCPDGSGKTKLTSLRSLRTGGGDSEILLAVLPCGGEGGPFWTGFVAGSFVVGWTERAPSRRDTGAAPIAGLAYVTVDGEKPSAVRRIAAPGDALVEAGCDKAGCYAVALTRPAGTDGMAAGIARVLKYPERL